MTILLSVPSMATFTIDEPKPNPIRLTDELNSNPSRDCFKNLNSIQENPAPVVGGKVNPAAALAYSIDMKCLERLSKQPRVGGSSDQLDVN